MRRAIARRLTESKQTVPHFTLRATIRVDAAADAAGRPGRDRHEGLGHRPAGQGGGAGAHRRPPDERDLDAGRDPHVLLGRHRGRRRHRHRSASRPSSAAWSGPRSARSRGTVRDLVDRARAGRLRQDELEGGSLTVTNLGMYGTEEFAAIINPPQSAILAVGAARQEPVVVDGQLAVATVLRATVSADHRVIDGALAAEWMAAFVAAVEQPLQLVV